MTRNEWCAIALKVSLPVLEPLAKGELKSVFIDKRPTACLEAFTRVLLGMSYWIESGEADGVYVAELARKALDVATAPGSVDYMDFGIHDQCLVEGAILAEALVRAPTQLWAKLPGSVQRNVIAALKLTRVFEPHDNNWVLFPSMIEAFLMSVGERVVKERLMVGIDHYMKWYCGDGMYKDGEEFHFDYYNSYIIQPMLSDILDVVVSRGGYVELVGFAELHDKRLRRCGITQERMIAPDGSYPPIGRSITYRCGAFHALAVCAYRNNLPVCMKPAQVRVALSRVIKATLGHPDTFDEETGHLTIGLYGKQPGLAEPYINHGSLYFCCTVFAPLGLAKDALFWSGDDDIMTTWEALQMGYDGKRDRPYTECVRKRGKCV